MSDAGREWVNTPSKREGRELRGPDALRSAFPSEPVAVLRIRREYGLDPTVSLFEFLSTFVGPERAAELVNKRATDDGVRHRKEVAA